MATYEIECDHRGSTYFGRFEVGPIGGSHKVKVSFKGQEIESELRGLKPEEVASTLLRELVISEFISRRAGT